MASGHAQPGSQARFGRKHLRIRRCHLAHVKVFAEIEQATSAFARPRLTAGDGGVRRALTAAVTELERCSGLLRLNLNESTALEEFLLTSLRLWSKR